MVLILSIPAVQTKLGKYATKRINEDYKTNINIGKVGLQFNGDVELKEILIKDYKLDTLFAISELNTSIISVNNLYNGKLTFGDIDIEDLVFNLKTYKDDTDTNLDIFVERFEDDNPRQGPSSFLLSSSDISIYDGVFRLIDENKETPEIIEFTELNANTTDFLINGPEVRTRINKLSFLDARDVRVENLMANFEYTLDHMSFEQLDIKTNSSNLIGNLRFDYDRKDFKEFTDKVKVSANFKDSHVQLSELNAFYNEFGTNQKASLSVDLSGTLNDLYAKNLNISTTRNTKIIGDIKLKNLFNSAEDNFVLEGRYRNLSSNYRDLTALLPNVLGKSIPTVFTKVGNFRLTGTSVITNEVIDADLDITTELGFVKSNLKLTNIDDIDNANYVGNIILEDFDIGSMLNDPLVGDTSLNLDVEGKNFALEDIETNIKGNVSYLDYNNYRYSGIDVSGDVGKNIFNGKLNTKDPNIILDFNGLADMSEEIRKFDFKANVTYANLRALNFVTRDSVSEFRGFVDMAVTGSTYDNLRGKINVKNTTYINQDKNYSFKDFDIVSSFNEDIRTIAVNSPDIINGQVKGKFNIEEIVKLSENALGSIYTNYKPHDISEGQYLDFNFKIYNQIAAVFDKNLNIGPNTRVKGRVETDEKGFELEFNSPRISFKDYIATDVSLEVDNSNPVYNTFLEVKKLDSDIYNVSDFSLINVTKRDTLFIKSEFKGGENNADDYDMNLFYTISDENKSVVGFQKSELKFKGFDWFVNSNKDNLNKITFDSDFNNFKIDDIRVNQGDEEILLAGVLRDSTYKDLNLDFKNVQLVKITPRIDSLALAGRVNGKLALLQNDGIYLPKSDIEIEQFNVNQYNLGNLKAIIEGDNSLTKYGIDVELQNTNVKTLDATGFVDVNKRNPNINVNVAFEDFLIDPLNPLGEGVISNIRGLVSGNAKVSGSLKKPSIDGELLLDKAGLGIPYLNVDYSFDFDSRVTLRQQQFVFNNVALTDSRYFSTGFLNGFIEHNNFSDWQLGLDLTTDRLLVLDTEESEDELYYGTGFVSGKADIKGYTDNLTIAVEGRTEDGTVFNIPLNDAESFGDNSYIKFLSPDEKLKRAKGEISTQTEIKGLNLEFNLDVKPNAEIEIVIDKDSGSTIKGRGEGILGIFINTNGKFEMYGDFSIFEGIYNFKYRGLAEKKFTVEPGGNIVWSGEPLGAQINLKALYSTTTNPSVLLDAPINRSIPVNLEINLTGPLERPIPDFTFDFPNVGSTIKSELDYRLSSKEDRDNQALYLLATGGFASGLADLNISGTISERLNGIIGSIFGESNDNFKVGVDLDLAQNNPNFETQSRVAVTLQTKLSDKVIVNGKVGVPFGSTTQTTIAGDVQIDWLLNDDGTLRATVFNRENTIQNFGDQIGFTQGLGLTYNVEFDTFKELLQKIFSGKDKKDKNKVKDDPKKSEEDVMPDFMSVKKKQN
ncbi:translocation/assembly module TamB domain-containing protein [uncultured Winogradskyella sp.]|uniref:translocation/assembly module TamB domain-containing protein n=1 Tax=uncultured Winogradskyella sp. TaxID=395353 RepID=UPI002615A92B|nr:translocation/assembly module TamB domain-containing protein [uncultured Winogradskyella sp.]